MYRRQKGQFPGLLLIPVDAGDPDEPQVDGGLQHPVPDAAALGRAIRAVREERGISQVQLALGDGLHAELDQPPRARRAQSELEQRCAASRGLVVSVSELAKRADAS
jgi:hypothetical protein